MIQCLLGYVCCFLQFYVFSAYVIDWFTRYMFVWQNSYYLISHSLFFTRFDLYIVFFIWNIMVYMFAAFLLKKIVCSIVNYLFLYILLPDSFSTYLKMFFLLYIWVITAGFVTDVFNRSDLSGFFFIFCYRSSSSLAGSLLVQIILLFLFIFIIVAGMLVAFLQKKFLCLILKCSLVYIQVIVLIFTCLNLHIVSFHLNYF